MGWASTPSTVAANVLAIMGSRDGVRRLEAGGPAAAAGWERLRPRS
jgi:hypothetical protein